MKRAQSLTRSFRGRIIAHDPGAEIWPGFIHTWVENNLETLGAYGQTQHNAEASCRCACQRLIKDGWLIRSGGGTYYRTARELWD